MNEQEFRSWLLSKGTNRKVIGDNISRLKKVEKELKIDLDKEYRYKRIYKVADAFSKAGNNKIMKEYGEVTLPIGKACMSSYRYAIRKYIQYKNRD